MSSTVTIPSLSHKPILDACPTGHGHARLSLPTPTALTDALSDTDRAALAQLKLDLALCPTLTPPDRAWANDACILRYLRAHNGDRAAALSGLMATLTWRASTAPHLIPVSRIRSEGISGKLVAHGFSRTGMPVLYMVPRHENSADEEGQLAYTLWTLEMCVRRMPPGVEKLVLVIDFAGMAMSNSVSPSMQRKFVSVLTAHYPERLSRAYLVNAPWFFGAVWRAIGPFLDPVTKAKVVFVDAIGKAIKAKSNGGASDGVNASSSSSSSPTSSLSGLASPADSAGTGSPKYSWGGLFGGGSSRSKSTPAPVSPTAESTADASATASADQMAAELDVVDLWQEFGGQCAFKFDPDQYFARVQELIDEADACLDKEVEAMAARERRVDSIRVEEEEAL